MELYQSSGQYLFNRYTTKIDNHAFRAEYARALYKELLSGSESPGKQYRGYEERVLREVSWALGHARLSVVVEHYMR